MLKDLKERPRRLRRHAVLRDLVHETELSLANLIQPYFVTQGADSQQPIQGFTDVFRWGIDKLSRKIELDLERGVSNFLLFGDVPATEKDETGSAAAAPLNVTSEAIRKLKARFGTSLVLFSDVCLCPSTSHGHCGVIKDGEIDNDPSVNQLARVALAHAEAGVDFVAPSDMMDGRIGTIRSRLDQQGFGNTGILAYTAKYASAYYGPFREALGSAPKGTDRASYQMDFRNTTEALRELRLDVSEGADMVMVKPALAYLDIISLFRRSTDLPVVAYSVSGEYEMVKQLAQKGLVDERKLAIENLTGIRRAGAHVIITYFASLMAEKGWLR
jgi:porphobilinogen synthase